MNMHSIIEEQAAEKANIPLDVFKQLRKKILVRGEDWELTRGTIRLSPDAAQKVFTEFSAKNAPTLSQENSVEKSAKNAPDPTMISSSGHGVKVRVIEPVECNIPEMGLAAVLGVSQAKLRELRKGMNKAAFQKVGKSICYSRPSVAVILGELEIKIKPKEIIDKVLLPKQEQPRSSLNLIFDRTYTNQHIVGAMHPGTGKLCRVRVRVSHCFVKGGLMPCVHEQADLWVYAGKYPRDRQHHAQMSRKLKNLAASKR